MVALIALSQYSKTTWYPKWLLCCEVRELPSLGFWLFIVKVCQGLSRLLSEWVNLFPPGGNQGTAGTVVCFKVHSSQKTRNTWCQNGLLQPGTDFWHDASGPCACKDKHIPSGQAAGQTTQAFGIVLWRHCSGRLQYRFHFFFRLSHFIITLKTQNNLVMSQGHRARNCFLRQMSLVM